MIDLIRRLSAKVNNSLYILMELLTFCAKVMNSVLPQLLNIYLQRHRINLTDANDITKYHFAKSGTNKQTNTTSNRNTTWTISRKTVVGGWKELHPGFYDYSVLIRIQKCRKNTISIAYSKGLLRILFLHNRTRRLGLSHSVS